MAKFSDFFQQQSSITLKQLQNQILFNKPRKKEEAYPLSMTSQSTDLKILSPFYARIDHHPKNCKCMYHKRIKPNVKKINRYRTQPNEFDNHIQANNKKIEERKEKKEKNQQQQERHSKLETEAMESLLQQEQNANHLDFKDWISKLSSEELNNNYSQYLKSLPITSKAKKHKELDCYNMVFEQFLKQRYLANINKKKSQVQLFRQAKSQNQQQKLGTDRKKGFRRCTNKIKTEGNINEDKNDPNRKHFNRTPSHKENFREKSQVSSKANSSSKQNFKFKKIGFKGTDKTSQLSDDQLPADKKEKRNKLKYFASRPSFFGLLEDQQVFKEICTRFMHQNKSENKEAEMMVKQLVDSDIDMYTKLMNDIQQDIQEGIFLRKLDNEHTNILVKIVLQKLNKQVQSTKVKNSNTYEKKNSIMQELINKYGWGQKQKPMGLQEFWKSSQILKQNSLSRKSLAIERQTRQKSEKNNKPFSNTKFQKDKKVLNQSRTSGISLQKSNQKFQSSNNSSGNNLKNINFKEKQEIKQDEKQHQESFRFNNNTAKNIPKKGVLMKKHKGKKLVSLKDQEGSLQPSKEQDGLVRKDTCTFKEATDEKENNNCKSNLQQQSNQRDGILQEPKQKDQRTSSFFYNGKSHVLRHMEAHKKFLKRIQLQLIDKQCTQMVIGIDSGIITKKRKIRAIYEALQKEQVKKSSYYNDLLKYVQIYAEYCDLVVKQKKKNKAKTQFSMGKRSETCLKVKNDEQQIGNFLQDLNNQRQLKYIELKWMKQQEDPKQEVVLKIPHFTTYVDKAHQKPKRVKLREEIQRAKTRLSENEFQTFQSSILQKDLQYKVNMQCNIDKSQSEDDINGNSNKKEIDNMWKFEAKLLKYRKIFNITQVDI